MTDIQGMHAPTPEFRAALEEEVVRALRRNDALPPSLNTRVGRRIRTAVAIAAGLVLGVGTNFAAGQVQDARQRDTLSAARAAALTLAVARLRLAESGYEQARKAFDAGALSRESLRASEAEVRSMRTALTKVELDLQEIRASAAPPRDELWAPRIGGRDFVKERLNVEAVAAQQRLTAAEAAVAEAQGAFRVGALSAIAAGEAEVQLALAQAQLELLARKLTMREEFIAQGSADNALVEDLSRKLQLLELEIDARRAERELKVAQTRLTVARARHAVGSASEVEFKRAELDVLERTIELEKLRHALDLLAKDRK